MTGKEIRELYRSKKLRDETGLFAAEGGKLFYEIPKDLLAAVFMTKTFAAEHPDIRGSIPDGVFIADDLTESRFEKIADTRSPQGILAAVRKPTFKKREVFSRKDPLLLLLESVQDPGNVGTMFRVGEAAGADALLLAGACADPYNPKVVRSTMGSIFRVPHFLFEDGMKAAKELKEAGIPLFAAHLKGRMPYDRTDLTGPSAIVIGNESRGISEELSAMADTLITIPMEGRVESLNAAMAAGVLLYEAHRQRCGADGV